MAEIVLGGSSVTGSDRSPLGTLLGVALLRLVQNGLLPSGVPALWPSVVTGGLLIEVLGTCPPLLRSTGRDCVHRTAARPSEGPLWSLSHAEAAILLSNHLR